jgi:coatomer subunit beta
VRAAALACRRRRRRRRFLTILALRRRIRRYWEVARKHDSAGKLLPEMILVCNALRNNLIHPNECVGGTTILRAVPHRRAAPRHAAPLSPPWLRRYVRGSTLRLLCKLREPQLLEPLVASIKGCLTHRHAYVRRNAVSAVFSLFKHNAELYPDAPDDVEKLLEDETDAGTRRNAFIMMFQVALDRALAFLSKNLERVRGAQRARRSAPAAAAARGGGNFILHGPRLRPPPPFSPARRCCPLATASR